MQAETIFAESFAPIMFERGGLPSGDVIFLSVDDAGTPGALNRWILTTLGLSDKFIPTDLLGRGYAFVDAGGYRLCFIVTVRISGTSAGTEFLLSTNLGNALSQIDKELSYSSVAQQSALRLWIPLMGTGAGGLAGDKSLSVILSVLETTRAVQRGLVFVVISSPPDTGQSEADGFQKQIDYFNRRLGFTSSQPLASDVTPPANQPSSDDLASPVSPTVHLANPDARRRAVLNNDQVTVDNDVLGAQMEMEALARIAADESTKAPLAIGIFGDWGAGKSSFMERMSKQVDALKASSINNGNETYRNAVPVRFNAWHYVDTNLWASLVENIFSCLDEYLRSQGGGAKLADSLFSKLATPQRLRLESAERVSNASKALEIAQRRLEQEREKAEVEQRRRSLDAGKLLRLGTRAFEEALSPEQKGALRDAVHELGLEDDIDTTQQLVKQAQRARTLVGRIALVCRSIASRGLSPTRIAVWVFLFACLTLLGWLIGGHVAQWLSGGVEGFAHRVGVVLGALLGAATTFVALAGKALKAVTALGRFAKKIQSEMSGLNAADEAARQELVALAERTVPTAVQELQVAKVDFESTSPQRLLTEFIRDKARGDSYSKHLGLVATIRKDFDRLSQIMCGTEEQCPEQNADQQKTILQYRDILEREGLSLEDGEASEDLKMLDRIILYIDDLDRCRPDKVAEVLQAVHLLLAFPLFVVVVAVDYRWVASALRAYYRGQLADEIDGVSGRADKRAASDAARTIAQPDDYIEKIFQIPYWVRPIDEATGAAFLESLTKDDVVPSSFDPQVALADEALTGRVKDNSDDGPHDAGGNSIPVPPTGPDTTAPPVSPPVELADQRIVLDQNEIDFMKRLAVIAGRTPRRLKRFVNSYRVIKAALRGVDLSQDSLPEQPGLLIPSYQAILLQLAFVTGHACAFIRYSDEQKRASESGFGVTQLAERLKDIIDQENCLPVDFILGLQLLSPNYDNSSTLIRMTEYTRLVARFSFCNPAKVAIASRYQ